MPDVVGIPKTISIKQFDFVLHPITAGTHDKLMYHSRKTAELHI